MRYFLVISVALLSACSSSTDVQGDPAILVTNNLPSDWVYVTWRDGQGIIGQDSVAPQTPAQCIRFVAQPDSASWTITASQTYAEFNETVRSTYGAPWFNPSDRPAWHITVSLGVQGGSPSIVALDVPDAC